MSAKNLAILTILTTINVSHADNIWTCFEPGSSAYNSNKEGTEGTYINGTNANSNNPNWECDGTDNKWSIGPDKTHTYDVVCYGEYDENFVPNSVTLNTGCDNITVNFVQEQYTTNSSDQLTGSNVSFTATNWSGGTQDIKVENIVCHGQTDEDTNSNGDLPNVSIDHSGFSSASNWDLSNFASGG